MTLGGAGCFLLRRAHSLDSAGRPFVFFIMGMIMCTNISKRLLIFKGLSNSVPASFCCLCSVYYNTPKLGQEF